MQKLPFEPDCEIIAEKFRAILVSLVGAVAVAKRLPGGRSVNTF
ncbi:hypothetical protein [Aidingimonas lacisalsi]|nr:hypothetical protein [Aidingimonas lacisalsi]